jgi:O-methyltransferase
MNLKRAFQLVFGSQARKDGIWYDLAQRRAARHGFHVYSQHMVWKEQPFFRKARQCAAGIKGIPDPRSFVLQSCIRAVANIDGDVAECGVRQGRSTLFMLTADEGRRQYHLFDSFAGLSAPGEQDRRSDGSHGWKEGDLSTEEEVARRNLSEFDNVTFHVGWIPDTLPVVENSRFAFVHIDVDLYEPTRDALAFFFDRLQPHGMIVCDDYGSARCPGARKAFDEFFAGRPEGIIELPTGQALVTKRG